MSEVHQPHGAASGRFRKETLADRFLANGGVASIAVFFIAVCLLFALSTNAFLSTPNLLNVIRQSAPLLIVAASMTFVITTGGIDLSVGSVLALVSALSAALLQMGVPWPAVIVAMLALGCLIGAVQGFFIAYEGIPAFIVTLAGLSVIRGVALLITGGYSIPIAPDSPFVVLGRGWLAGVPIPAWIALAVLVAAFVVFNSTRFAVMSPASAPMPRRCAVPASIPAGSYLASICCRPPRLPLPASCWPGASAPARPTPGRASSWRLSPPWCSAAPAFSAGGAP